MVCVSSEHFDMAAAALKKFYPDPTSLAVHGPVHVCPTYVATTVSADKPFILQFRTRDRALTDPKTYETVTQVLGSLAPSIKLLGEHDSEHEGKTYLVYEQTKLPGQPISCYFREPDMMAIAAEGVGRLLAKCLIPGTRCGVDRARDGWFERVMSELDMACATEDPVLQSYKSEFMKVRDAVAAGGLDDLPLAFKNGDMHALNILVTETGEVGGLVDWEGYEELSLGTVLSTVIWMMHQPRADPFRYEKRENTSEIEARFWKGFFLEVPREVAKQRKALQLAMKVGVVLDSVYKGENVGPTVGPLIRSELEYAIRCPRLTPY